jgi:transposase
MASKYDVEKKQKELKALLQELKQQEPGKMQSGTKLDVLRSMIDDLKVLVEQGYTPAQIAAAISKSDDFKILPKSVTQVLEEAKGKPRKPRSKKLKEKPKQEPKPVRPDSDDL